MGQKETEQVTTSVAEDNRVAVGDGGKSLVARDNSTINVTADEAFNLAREVVGDYANLVEAKDYAATELSFEALALAEGATESDLKEIVELALKMGLAGLAVYAALKVMK